MSISHESINNYKIYYLTQAQYDALVVDGSVTVDGQTITYDPNAEYRTPDTTGDAIAAKLTAPTVAGTAGQILEQGSNGPVWADRDKVVTVTGTTPTINALPGVRYVCDEVTTLDITLPTSGIVDVTFESGSTATVLMITPPTGVTLKWANGFDPSSLEANTTYELNICDGLGVAASWT